MAYFLRAARLGIILAALVALDGTGCSSSLQTGGGTGGTAAGGSGGQGGGVVDTNGGFGGFDAGGAVDAGGDGVCHDYFAGGVEAPCCPDPPPDCASEPDGYPGHHCVDPHNQFCSCGCWSGKWQCGC